MTSTFWMDRTDRCQVSLRRFTFSDHARCPKHETWGHDASVVILPDAPLCDWLERNTEADGRWVWRKLGDVPRDDPRWPSVCKFCREPIPDSAEWQVNAHVLYGGAPDGKLFTIRDLPPGAMYDADWLPETWGAGPDGIHLMVILPNGKTWHVDGPASNCTMPKDHEHRCWVRHGDPRGARLTVDKSGHTCAAGAGSILAGDYHGFLRDGVLT